MIKPFNNDLPYDQFLKKRSLLIIEGAGSAGATAGPGPIRAGLPDDRLKLDQYDDRIDTLMRGSWD